MGEFFSTVYGSELDGTRATKSELLEYAINLNPGASRHIMVGDRKHDLAGAIANNMTPVGVAYGYGSIEELEDAGATAIAQAPADLPRILL
jgi:phosphoglycolate phosphatase